MEKTLTFMMTTTIFLMTAVIIYSISPYNFKNISQEDLIQMRVKELYIEYKASELVEKMLNED